MSRQQLHFVGNSDLKPTGTSLFSDYNDTPVGKGVQLRKSYLGLAFVVMEYKIFKITIAHCPLSMILNVDMQS